MQRTRAMVLATTAGLAAAIVPAAARAGANEVHLGPTLGGTWSTGAQGGIGGLAGLAGGYGINDTFVVYGEAHYGLAVGSTNAASPRHEASLSAGVAYTLDVLSLVPWFGLGAQGALVSTPSWTGVIPAIEARAGLDWLISRGFGATFQFAYGFVVANRDRVDNNVSALLGLRWTIGP